MSFATELKRNRLAQHLSQQDLADQLFISRQTVSKWENEVSYPDIDKLMAISSLFGVSIDYLLGNDSKLKESVLMKNKIYRVLKTSLKYVGAIGIFVLVFLGVNAWLNRPTEMQLSDLKINNTFFEKKAGHLVLNVYGELKPTFASSSGGIFGPLESKEGTYNLSNGKQNIQIYGEKTRSPFGNKTVAFEIPEDAYHEINLMEKDIYLADRKGGKVKLYDHRTQTQPYSHDQKNSKQILKLMKQYKDVGYGEELKE